MDTVYTKDGRPDGIPHVNDMEVNYSRRRYSYCLSGNSEFYNDKEVLDLGCGWGAGTKLIADNGAKHVTAIDFNPDGIELAKEKYSAENIDYIHTDVDDFVYEASKYDIVVAVEFVEHLTGDQLNSHLDKWHGTLKKDGYLYISTPERRLPKDRFPEGSHWTEYDFGELVDLVEEHGFKIIWFQRKWHTKDTAMALVFKKKD